MSQLLLACLLLPLISLILIFLSDGSEKKIANISFWFNQAMGASIFLLLLVWGIAGFPQFQYEWFTLYQEDGYSFPVLFLFDKISAAYLFCIWTIFAVIIKYCRVYLHRELGYKRFFQTIFGFAFGLNLIVLSGNIDILFAGWEVVGISSFLLIAFYRHRPQPVRNALRAYTIYRFCDVGLLLGAWMSHLLFHEQRNFIDFAQLFSNPEHAPAGYLAITFFAWLIILAASGKSAQFPFSFWLPRAMEGPTPSSAIFYGALSIHLGVFLLLRTMPIWSYQWMPRFMIFSIGFLTVLVGALSEKTQSNIKGQVAYASISQVGFMFMELALGLESLVLIHFMGNAFLRCYQLLVSPSIVAHLLRVEGAVTSDFNIKSTRDMQFLPASLRGTLPDVIQNTLYVLALQEGNLDRLVKNILWEPLKKLGVRINQLPVQIKITACTGLLVIVWLLSSSEDGIGNGFLAFLVSLAMMAAALSAFSQKHNPINVWNGVALSSMLAGGAVYLLNGKAGFDVLLFMSGILPAWLLGLWVLMKMLKHENFAETPFVYRAMAETQPKLALLLFLSFLGLVGFPITPAFLGEDLLLSYANEYPWFALPMTVTFVVNGIAAARVFLRLCMGRPTEISYVDQGR